MSNNSMLKEKLIRLTGKIETINEIAKAKGENFNLFSILGMERLEVKTHSAFIFELINTKGSHAQGTLYLRLFMQSVLKKKIFNYENVIIKREAYYDKGRIDFTIENSDMFLAIEMKIDAQEQNTQLDRYIEIAKNQNKKSEVYYLTLDGRDPDDIDKISSIVTISFMQDILKWIELCIEKSANLPILRESLVQYMALIKKITNQTSKDVEMEIVNMIDNPAIAESATIMSQNIGFVWAKREAKFWIEIIKNESNFNKKGWKLLIDEPYYEFFYNNNNELKDIDTIAKNITEYRQKQNNDIEIFFSKKINNYEIELLLYQFNNDEDLQFQLNEIELLSSEKYKELSNKLGLNRTIKNVKYGKSNLNINFYGHKSSIGNLTYILFDDNELKKLANNTIDKIDEKLQIIDEFIK